MALHIAAISLLVPLTVRVVLRAPVCSAVCPKTENGKTKIWKGSAMADEKRRQQWRESKRRSRTGEVRGAAQCGTVSMYTLHRKRGEDCAVCRAAWAAYRRERRRPKAGDSTTG